jgi:hypothetical protein
MKAMRGPAWTSALVRTGSHNPTGQIPRPRYDDAVFVLLPLLSSLPRPVHHFFALLTIALNCFVQCFWLVRNIDEECISTCGEGLVSEVNRDLARCQEGYDGFSADLRDNIRVQAETTGFIDIPGGGEYVAAGMGARHALFSYGSGFDVRNGIYTANTAGLYLVMANVRLVGANVGDMVAAAIKINGESDAGNGLTVRQHNIASGRGTEGLWTLTMCGVVQLEVAETMNVAVSLPEDDNFYIHSETGFHAVALQTHSGFAAALTEPVAVTEQAGEWTKLTTFVTDGVGMFDQLYSSGTSVFDTAEGTFTAPEDGLYFTSASIRLSAVARVAGAGLFNTRISIALNSDEASRPDITEGTGLTTIGSDEPNSQGDRHEVLTGVLQLDQGDRLSVWLQVDDGESYFVDPESSFTAVAMESPEGFEVQLVRDTAMTNRESFVELAGFRTVDTYAESPGLFATTFSALGFASGLDTLTGRYTAAFPGVYFAQTTVRFAGANEGNFIRVVIAMNGEVDFSVPEEGAINGGISAISGEIDDRTKDIDAAGLLSLNVGDFFSVWVKVGGTLHGDDDYTIKRQSRFASVFITSPPRNLTQCPGGEQPNADYNGDTCSDCLASGASCARCENVFGFDCRCACVAEECVEIANPDFGGDTCSDCLHSGASCEDCRDSRFNFNCDCACNDNDEWAFWRPDRCFEVDCGQRGFCYEGSCLCVDGYRGTSCIVPPGQGMLCSEDRLVASQTCDNAAGEPVVSLGTVSSQASCRTLCRTQAESGTSVEAGCCQWNGVEDGTMNDCEYIPGVTATVDDTEMSASICELAVIQTADDDYSLIVDDCTDIQPVTTRLVEAVIKLHSQLQNRACVEGYFENEFGICEPNIPIIEPVVSVTPQACTGRNPSRRGEQVECAFLGSIITVPGPTGEEDGPLAGMKFASDDAMVLLHPFATSTAGGFPLSSRDNPEGKWTLDTWIETPLEPGQWRTLVRGATGDSQILVAPAQESEWQSTRYSASVGSLTTDDPGYFYGSTDPPEVTNWDSLGSFQTPGTTIPAENAQAHAQDYYTNLVQASRLSLGTYTGSGDDAGAGLPENKFTDTNFDISTLDAGVCIVFVPASTLLNSASIHG